MQPLPRPFYDRDAVVVARELLGKLLLRATEDGTCIGRIVETEAYLAENDPASHSYRGPNRKNATMFQGPGLLYVYVIHARYCMNVVTQPPGTASAVLLRAVEPLAGVDLMGQRRGQRKLQDLARGPPRLCEEIALNRQLDGWDLTSGQQVWIAADPDCPPEPIISNSPRIGVTSAHDLPLRFFIADSPFVSGRKKTRIEIHSEGAARRPNRRK
jgi:DNA-3-methyladenine glycosylase